MCMYSMHCPTSLQKQLPELTLVALMLGTSLRALELPSILIVLLGSSILAPLILINNALKHKDIQFIYSVTLIALAMATVLSLLMHALNPLRYAMLMAGTTLLVYSVTRFGTIVQRTLIPLSAVLLCLVATCLTSHRAMDLALPAIAVLLLYLSHRSLVRRVSVSFDAKQALISVSTLALCLVLGSTLKNVLSAVVASMSLGYAIELLSIQNAISRSPWVRTRSRAPEPCLHSSVDSLE